MPKKNNFISANISFEDFEMNLNNSGTVATSAEELVRTNAEQERSARKKEQERKKAYRKRKEYPSSE